MIHSEDVSRATVTAENLTKIFHDKSRGEVRAVDGIDFGCSSGEIFGLLGPNGAGKTTTLRMVATVLEPTSGRISVLGRNTRKHPVLTRRSMGFYSSTTALYQKLTARETVEFFAGINGYPEAKIRNRAEDLIRSFDMESFANTRVEKLSQGMKQKVSLARTVAHDPPVLVFDEPTMGLDVINAVRTRKIITELRDQGKTVLFSTHVMSEAEKLCDRIAIIHEGRLLACGTMEELRRRTGLHYLEDVFLHLLREEE
ncbi:ATP-binding cassette domain-containing protein [Candidatus Fermentibacteria bacterium]|nr:ATP-binding cassette domain-containing protein [Candidatus Fermentibacteria bacterium]